MDFARFRDLDRRDQRPGSSGANTVADCRRCYRHEHLRPRIPVRRATRELDLNPRPAEYSRKLAIKSLVLALRIRRSLRGSARAGPSQESTRRLFKKIIAWDRAQHDGRGRKKYHHVKMRR